MSVQITKQNFINKFQFIVFGMLTIVLGCKPKERLINNISCNGKVVIQYDRINYNHKTKPQIPKESKIITVIFLSEYKDSVHGYIDNKLVYNQFVNQRDYDDSRRYNFSKLYTKNSKPKIKIESKTKKTCFDIEVDPRYRFAYVWLFEKGNWQIRFSNSYYYP